MTWKARVKSQTLGFSKLRARTRRCGQAWPLACSPRPSLCSWLCPHLAGLTGTCVDTRSSCPQAITPFCPPRCRAALETERRKTPKKQTWVTRAGQPGIPGLGAGSRHRIQVGLLHWPHRLFSQWKGMLRGGPGRDISLCLVLECFIKHTKDDMKEFWGKFANPRKKLGKKRFPEI